MNGGRIHRRRAGEPRIMALASGKGGIGRTTLTLELARALARHEQHVLLVDLNPRGLAIMTALDMALPEVVPTLGPGDDISKGVLATSIERVSLVMLHPDPVALEDLKGGPSSRGRIGSQGVAIRRLLNQVRAVSVDWVIFDLPAGYSSGLASLFLSVDLPVLITTPEPASLVGATQFLRLCATEAVRSHAKTNYADPLLEEMSTNPAQWDFVQLFKSAKSDYSRGVLMEACERVRIGLVVNQMREGSESQQALALCHAWAMDVGIWLRLLGTVRYDDRRWFYARRMAPAAHHPRDESVAGDVEQVVRLLLALNWERWAKPPPCLPCVDPDVEPGVFLDLPDGTTAELKQRYRRLWEGYRRDNGLVSFVMDEPGRKRAVGLLERANRRAAVEGNTGLSLPRVDPAAVVDAAAVHRSVDDVGTPNAAPKTAPLPSGGKHPGARLRLARMGRSLGLRELSLRTRVGMKHIGAIENMNQRELPGPAYLRAYLTEIAKTLGLDGEAVVDEYVAYLESQKD